jgi:hypothetical protein
VARATPIALKRRNDVGIAVDVERGQIYLARSVSPHNAGEGHANIEIPKGQSAVDCTDIKVLFDCLPESIDLDLNIRTDHSDPPNGNMVNRPMDFWYSNIVSIIIDEAEGSDGLELLLYR